MEDTLIVISKIIKGLAFQLMLNIVNVLEISSRFHYMRPDDHDKAMKIPTDSHSEICFFTAV